MLAWGRESGWPELVTKQPGTLEPLQVDSEAPYLLAYTSGTTGRPKGALHVQGGFLVSIAREVAYQTDVKRGDRVFFSTDMGWIMGPWTVVGAGAVGATVIYAEGAPDWPHDRLWETVESERVTMLGVSPTLIRALIPKGEPTQDLSSLEAICTTGEPWNRDPYLWLFEHGRRRSRADRQHLRRHRGRRVLPLDVHRRADQAGRARLPRARRGHGRRRRARDARCAARSASSCAGGRGPG